MDVYQRLAYMQIILRGDSLKKHKAVLFECKQLVKDLAGDGWTLGDLKEISTDDLWTWAKSDRIGYGEDAYLGLYKCVYFCKGALVRVGKGDVEKAPERQSGPPQIYSQ